MSMTKVLELAMGAGADSVRCTRLSNPYCVWCIRLVHVRAAVRTPYCCFCIGNIYVVRHLRRLVLQCQLATTTSVQSSLCRDNNTVCHSSRCCPITAVIRAFSQQARTLLLLSCITRRDIDQGYHQCLFHGKCPSLRTNTALGTSLQQWQWTAAAVIQGTCNSRPQSKQLPSVHRAALDGPPHRCNMQCSYLLIGLL